MNKPYTAFPTILPLLLCFALLAGCSVLEPIGEFFSSGYENTVSYFNAYYNAKKTFDEAEKEIITQERSLKTRTADAAQPARVSEQVKGNLAKVIDKCSHILSFYQSSAVADDALLLIGKSYFYQMDYIKAERKFSELVAKYPESPLVFESQLWFVKTLEKMNRLDDAVQAGELLVKSALESEEESIAGETCFVLATIAVTRGNQKEAEEYFQRTLELSDDDFIQGTAQTRIGDLNFERGEYEKAAAAYLQVSDVTSDIYLNYYSRLQAVIAYRSLKRYDSSLFLLEEMKEDYRFADYFGMIHFEIGNTFALRKELDQAIAEYQYVDTTFARTDVGAKASFELAKLLQYTLGNYQEAKLVYDRAAMNASFASAPIAAKRALALAKYFDIKNQMRNIDSLKNLPDPAPNVQRKPDSSQTILEPDSLKIHTASQDSLRKISDSSKTVTRIDTLAGRKDSLQTPQVRLSKDSITVMYARLAYELGELFYAELDSPDSASFWLTRAYHTSRDTARTPRALFVLAELARADSLTFGKPTDYYDRLFKDYPTSSYAERALIILGLKSAETPTDSAEYYYSRGSLLMESGNYKESIRTFDSLHAKYPASPFAPKSVYAKAWIYENHLKLPDSAIAQYKYISEKYSSSLVAAAAKRRVPDPEQPKAAPDTLKKEKSAPADSLNRSHRAKADDEDYKKADSVAIGKSVPSDSTQKSNRAAPDDADFKKVPDPQVKKETTDSSAVRRGNRVLKNQQQ